MRIEVDVIDIEGMLKDDVSALRNLLSESEMMSCTYAFSYPSQEQGWSCRVWNATQAQRQLLTAFVNENTPLSEEIHNG